MSFDAEVAATWAKLSEEQKNLLLQPLHRAWWRLLQSTDTTHLLARPDVSVYVDDLVWERVDNLVLYVVRDYLKLQELMPE